MVLTAYGSYVDGPYGVWFVRRWSLRRMVRTSMVLTAYGSYVDGPYGVCSLRRMVLTVFPHYGEWSLRWIVLTVNGPNDIITTDITNSPSGFTEVRVAQSLVFCVAFYRSLFVLFLLVIEFSMYGFWLTLCYLQTFLTHKTYQDSHACSLENNNTFICWKANIYILELNCKIISTNYIV